MVALLAVRRLGLSGPVSAGSCDRRGGRCLLAAGALLELAAPAAWSRFLLEGSHREYQAAVFGI